MTLEESGVPARYDPKEAEAKWREHWEREAIYASTPDANSITIDTPPPTMSGKMHVGHAYSYSQEDFYARFFRMRTGNVFYPFGTDDNGLPTEKLVEKLKSVKSTKMSRKDFRELCLKTVQELKEDFVSDWKALGISCDYRNMYSTIDAHAQATSQRSFLDLYHKQRVYRQESPVSWCVLCQTAIAQAEFDNIEQQSTFNTIAFHAGAEELLIATTRPELIPACVALAAHPEDARYKHLAGKHITVPLSNHSVPLIFDEKVDIEKGTGLMMVCTFGDKEDVEKWHTHKLPLRVIFTKDGKLNELAGKYVGLTIKEARKAVLDDLKASGALKVQKPITHAVNVHERCGTEIEFLKTTQWYVKVLDLKEQLLKAGSDIAWHPEHMRVRYDHWVENLGWDWCISRQRHYGVPFPVWYDKRTGETYVAHESQLPVDPFTDVPKNVPAEVIPHLIPESDVMDTWATSSSSPQIVLNWHEHPERMQALLPMTLRPQAHDIIRTWAFYTIVKAVLNNHSIPWKHIAMSGYVTDPKGEKMSKSKGNVVDPRTVREKYSADAIRYWAAGAKLGDDIPYLEKDLVTGQKTINKLWNASRFVLLNLQDYDAFTGSHEELEVIDRWILSKFSTLITECTAAFERYDHSTARRALEQFFWTDFCDQYLEIVKGRLYAPQDILQKRSAQFALHHIMDGLLCLFAPFLPFIAEEIYHLLPQEHKSKSVHLAQWPVQRPEWKDAKAEMVAAEVVQIINEVRKYKTDHRLAMNAPLPVLRVTTTRDLTLAAADLLSVTKAEKFEHIKGEFAVQFE